MDVALRFRLAPGWHTYWRNPGDTGMPIQLEWNLPDGVLMGPVQWPTPSRISSPDVTSFGYEKECYLFTYLDIPTDLEIEALEMSISADVSLLICSNVCLPFSTNVTASWVFDSSSSEAGSMREMSAARKALPESGDSWFCHALTSDNIITLHGKAPEPFSHPSDPTFFYPELPRLIRPASDQHGQSRGNIFEIAMSKGDLLPLPDQFTGVLVYGERSVRITARLTEKKTQ